MTKGLPNPVDMPVPASFNELFSKSKERNYVGDFWYQTEFYVPSDWDKQDLLLRFGSLTHRGTIYLNGIKISSHEGGFLPVVVDITVAVKIEGKNLLVIKMNNEVSSDTLPVGAIHKLHNGEKVITPGFDFFNYAGIQRNVWLLALPKTRLMDYQTSFEINESDAEIKYHVSILGEADTHVELYDKENHSVAEADGADGKMKIKNSKLWTPDTPYLYTIVISSFVADEKVDEYSAELGIRTFKVKGHQFLLNNQPIFLKGFGKHEDFYINGKGLNPAVIKRDYANMKWIHANCFRTSHYPYDEEWYQEADREGFLIIDEVPAVGMMHWGNGDFIADGAHPVKSFFDGENTAVLKQRHLDAIHDMIKRDHNHPSVIAWSLFNEAETTTDTAEKYFKDIFSYARTLDEEKRPVTGTLVLNSLPKTDRVHDMCDFICLNRYYGWYIKGGVDFPDAEGALRKEIKEWLSVEDNKPYVFTEFGADTLSGQHSLTGQLWTEEYQKKYYKMNLGVMSDYPQIQGELVWTFADFETSEAIYRPLGNNKGIFNRAREPKEAAFLLKKIWENK